jgi:hypothetical protein
MLESLQALIYRSPNRFRLMVQIIRLSRMDVLKKDIKDAEFIFSGMRTRG